MWKQTAMWKQSGKYQFSIVCFLLFKITLFKK